MRLLQKWAKAFEDRHNASGTADVVGGLRTVNGETAGNEININPAQANEFTRDSQPAESRKREDQRHFRVAFFEDRCGVPLPDEMEPGWIGLYDGRQRIEWIPCDQFLLNCRIEELTCNLRALANRVLPEFFDRDKVNPPCFSVAHGDFTESLVRCEEFDQVSASVAVDSGRTLIHVGTSGDIAVDEFCKPDGLPARNETDRGQPIGEQVFKPGEPRKRVVSRRIPSAHRCGQPLDVSLDGQGVTH